MRQLNELIVTRFRQVETRTQSKKDSEFHSVIVQATTVGLLTVSLR
jgi:hypothetical protein